MQAFWLCFVPLFVAVDAFGILPLFITLTEGNDTLARRRIILQSVLTATLVTLIFVLAGSAFLRLLGITIADFMVAGGILLFTLSLTELIAPHRTTQVASDGLGAVPLEVPLLAGPAVLTTSMLLGEQYGRTITIAAVIYNMFPGRRGVVVRRRHLSCVECDRHAGVAASHAAAFGRHRGDDGAQRPGKLV